MKPEHPNLVKAFNKPVCLLHQNWCYLEYKLVPPDEDYPQLSASRYLDGINFSLFLSFLFPKSRTFSQT